MEKTAGLLKFKRRVLNILMVFIFLSFFDISLAQTTFKANVNFTGTQFIIKNNDSFDWKNVKLEINPGYISNGYILIVPLIKAGKTYTVGAMQFTKSDGTRFNPFNIKPKQFFIFSTNVPNAIDGSWMGEFH